MPDVEGEPGGHVREKSVPGGASGHDHREPEAFAEASAPVGSLTRYSIGGLPLSAGGGTPRRGPVGVLPAQPASVQPGELVRDVVRGAGVPLAPEVRDEMSDRFGADFSAVRLHTDAAARRSATALGARAYTAGDHIVAGAGTLDRHTLAHELVHVVQQRLLPAAGTTRGLRIGDPAGGSERAAEAGAREALSGDGAPLAGHVDAPAGGEGLLVQRQIDAAALPATVLAPDADLHQLRSYLDSVVDTRNGLTFRKVVADTIAAFPEEAEAASLSWHWNSLRYVLDPTRANMIPSRFIRADLVELAEGVNSVHGTVRDDVLRRARAMHADATKFLKDIPLTAPSLREKAARVGKWLQSGDHELPAHDLATVRTFLDDLGPEINAHYKRGRLVEKNTRMGFEIETGNHLLVQPAYVTMAESLINVTLASTDRVEFLIDDIKPEGPRALVQVEFRTRPFTRKLLKDAKELKTQIDADLKNFPIRNFGKNVAQLPIAPAKGEWTGTPELDRLAPGLTPLTKSVAPKMMQHVTHSIPLARFVRLHPEQKKRLIPGSEKAGTVEQLLEFFLTKKILPQTQGGEIVVSTRGRNEFAPNVKSALDTISGFLPPDRFDKLVRTGAFAKLPGRVRIEAPGGQEPTGSIGRLTRHEEIPPFPTMNVEQGKDRAHLAAEEKLAPVLFDPRLKDLRVLVEHRGDALVRAVNEAMLGNPVELDKYLAVFKDLDDSKLLGLKDEETFGHWFT
ncbi:DUF4157 domain-containing protein [Amycolatopsis sp. NBC_00355]|uniref:eCIS core domain-containing protein n=1 Tax=Amycolatopsis sp. NBC_00355 TaxID=2975957 RepID=UPI002E275E5A